MTVTTERLTWTKLANGDLLCVQHPIRLQKPLDRFADSPGWLILVPTEAEHDAGGDDWWWRAVPIKHETWPLQAANEREARTLVVEELDHVLAWIIEGYPEWTTEQRAKVIEYTRKRHEETEARRIEIEGTLAAVRANQPAPPPAKPKGPSPTQMRKMLAEALDLLDRARPDAISDLGRQSWLMRRDALREQAQGIPAEH